jgi:copper chaperone
MRGSSREQMMERVTMKIEGMSCGHCVAAVKGALEPLAGVQVEQVSIGEAVLAYDPAVTSPSAISEAIEDEGYAVVSTQGADVR